MEKTYTIDDIENLPDGIRAELIDGEIYYMGAPDTDHQRISRKLSHIIDNHIITHNSPCEVFYAPYAVYLNEDDKNYIEPDIIVVCDPKKVAGKVCKGAPDLIIEIVSQGSRQMDYFNKLFKYQTSNVKEYWIVDQEKKRVTVYNFKAQETIEYTLSDSIKVGIFEDLYIDFSLLF